MTETASAVRPGLVSKLSAPIARFLPGRILRRIAPDVYRARKEEWEFEWQRTQWAELYALPGTREKVRAYWQTHRFLGQILERVPILESTRVLDVGCGLSTVLELVPGLRFGIDPLGDRYKTIHTYGPGIDVRKAYAEDVPFPAAHFDVVFCSNVVDHTEDPVRVIQEVRRVLVPGGHFVLTCEVFPDDLGERNAAHPYSMTAERLLALVNGFEPVARWTSPWYGMRGYVLGHPPTGREEYVLLLRKPEA